MHVISTQDFNESLLMLHRTIGRYRTVASDR